MLLPYPSTAGPIMLVLLANAAYAFHATADLGKITRTSAISRSHAAEMGFFGKMGFGGECPFPHGQSKPKMQTAEAPTEAPAWRGTAKDWWPNKVNLNLLKGNDPTGGETTSCAPRVAGPLCGAESTRFVARAAPPTPTRARCPQTPRSLRLSTSTKLRKTSSKS